MNTDDPAELVAEAHALDDLYRKLIDTDGRAIADALRRGRVALVQLAALVPAAGTCPACGAHVVQPARGRRRIYCTPRCRATQWRRNAKVIG